MSLTLRRWIAPLAEGVRSDTPDLSARQMCVLFEVYIDKEAQTVRGLAAKLNISKPAVTRALDRLGELDLARRKVDPMDRRSVLVQRTIRGSTFMTRFEKAINEGLAMAEQEG